MIMNLNNHERIRDVYRSVFEEVDFGAVASKDYVDKLIEDAFWSWSYDIDKQGYNDFWNYYNGIEISYESYKNIRKKYLDSKLKIETNDIDEPQIIEIIRNKLIKKLLYFEEYFDIENKNFIKNIMGCILNIKNHTIFYDEVSDNDFEDTRKEKVFFKGSRKICERNELTGKYIYTMRILRNYQVKMY